MDKCKYEGTGVWNGRCIGTKEVDPCPGYDKCKRYKPNYTTNADRIRAMSDEELAEIIACPKGLFDRMDCFDDGRHCEDCILKWLRQAVEGEMQKSNG